MENVYNRVAVIYPFNLPDGSQESRTTAWVDDLASQDRYGTRELLYGMPDNFSMSPETVRDNLLARLKQPGAIVSTQGQSSFYASLNGMGEWVRTESIYFTNFDGLVEHADGSGSQTIGYQYQNTTISFAGAATTPSDGDEMADSAGGFGPLVAETQFTVRGAAQGANNQTATVQTPGTNLLTTLTSDFVTEAAGALVRITIGSQPSSEFLHQKFTVDTNWTATHVAVRVRKIGSPADSFRIGLYPDSGGVPGTVIAFNETLGSALFTELTWVEFELSAPVPLIAGTTYWLGMRRTGSQSLSNGYEVAVDEDLGYADGNMLVWNGSAWIARDPDADLQFRIIGEIDSSDMIEKAISALPTPIAYAIVRFDSGINVRQYVDSPQPVSEILEEMIDAGMADGQRIIAHVSSDSTAVIVENPPASSLENLLLGQDGKLRYGAGHLYPPGKLIFGQYVDMDGLALFDSLGVRGPSSSSVYVQESEYDGVTDTISIQSEGALDPYRSLIIRKG
jgi:hypothetical protein